MSLSSKTYPPPTTMLRAPYSLSVLVTYPRTKPYKALSYTPYVSIKQAVPHTTISPSAQFSRTRSEYPTTPQHPHQNSHLKVAHQLHIRFTSGGVLLRHDLCVLSPGHSSNIAAATHSSNTNTLTPIDQLRTPKPSWMVTHFHHDVLRHFLLPQSHREVPAIAITPPLFYATLATFLKDTSSIYTHHTPSTTQLVQLMLGSTHVLSHQTILKTTIRKMDGNQECLFFCIKPIFTVRCKFF